MVAELVVATTESVSLRGYSGTSVELSIEELAQRPQQLESQVGQQCAVIEHQREQLMRHELQLSQLPQDTRVNLVDPRVGKKTETFAG